MKRSRVWIVFALAALSVAQTRREPERPLRQPVRGVHGAVAAGSEWATEAGMRMYYKGGNAVDVGVATMFAGSVSELSHYGFGRRGSHSDSHEGRESARDCGRGHDAENGNGGIFPQPSAAAV